MSKNYGKKSIGFDSQMMIAKLKESQKELEEQKRALRERNKEISCIFQLSELVQKHELSLEELFRRFVLLIPAAFQNPSITSARISFNKTHYQSEPFVETPFKLANPFLFYGEPVGSLEVYVLEQDHQEQSRWFLESEKHLINSLSERLGHIAERKDSERKVFDSERKFRALFETMAQGVIYHDGMGKIIDANPAAEKILGFKLSQIQGRDSADPIWKAIHEDGSEYSGPEHPAIKALATGQPVNGKIMGVYHHQEGKYHWIKVNATPEFRQDEQQPYQVYSSFEDVTKQIEMTQALEKSREQYFQLFENIQNGVVIYRAVDNGEDFQIIDINKAAENMERRNKNEVIGKLVTQAFPGIRDFGLLKIFKKVWQTGQSGEHNAEYYHDHRISGWRNNRVYKLPSGEIVAVYEDYSEKKKAQEELERFKTISDQALYGTCITDAEGTIIYINDYFAHIHGYERQAVVGKHISIFHTKEQLQCLKELTQHLLETKGVFPATETWHLRKDGKEFPMLMSGLVLQNYSGSKPMIATSAVDISDQKELEFTLKAQQEELKATNEEMEAMNEELIESEEQARKANQAKNEFLANMSHELRTPLNGIIGFSEIVKGTLLTEDQLRYMDIVLTSANHLLEIIGDILDFSRIEAGKYQLHPEKTQLRVLVEKMISILRYSTQEKGLSLVVDMSDDIPAYVQVDGSRLRQILLNLLSNAIKFTEKGKIVLTINRLKMQDDRVRLLFSVTDTGIGIKQDDQEIIFRPFHQLDMSNTRAYGGTGLGLAISRDLLQKMNSTLKLKSIYGEGSEFSFELLLPYYEPKPVSTEDLDPAEPVNNCSYSGKKILIVEDNHINMEYVKTALSLFSKDLQIIEAHQGKEAYQQYLNHKPDLILMDIIMPKVDGYQATAMIRQEDTTIPIVAMTAKAMKEDRQTCLEAGMNDYITKPVSLNQLNQILDKYLKE